MLNKVPEVTLFFFIAYILTRPLGASIGDLLSQTTSAGGLGLGTTVTSGLFLAVILAVMVGCGRTEKRRRLAETEPPASLATA